MYFEVQPIIITPYSQSFFPKHLNTKVWSCFLKKKKSGQQLRGYKPKSPYL